MNKEQPTHVRLFAALLRRRLALAALAIAASIVVSACLCFISAEASAKAAEAATIKASDPENRVRALYLEARLALASGDRERAIKRFEELMGRPGCPPQAYMSLAELRMKQLQAGEAAKTLDEGLKAYPDSLDLLILQARLLRQTGQIDKALARLNHALTIEPHRQQVLEDLSETHLARLRQITTEKDLAREIDDLAAVYERMLETRRGMERLAPLMVLSSLYLRTDKPQRSITAAEEAVSINPREIRCWQTLAAAQEALGKPADALKSCKQALMIDSNNLEAREKIEKLADAAGGAGAKLKFFGELAGDFPNDKPIQELYVKALVQEKRWAEAETQLRKLTATWPDDVQNRIGLARVWVALGRVDEGLAEARRIGQKHPELAPVIALTMAEALLAQGSRARAVDVLIEYDKAHPANENVTMGLATILIEDKKTTQAVTVLEKFRRARPDFFLGAALLAQAYIDRKNFDGALKLLTGLPDPMRKQYGDEIMRLQADLYRRLKNWDKALEILLALQKKHPEVAQHYLDAGTVYQEMARNDEAEKLFRQAIKIDPQDAEVYNTLGYFYAETNQKLDEALGLINKAAAMKPGAGHIMDSLGWVLYRRGDFQGAVEKLKLAAQIMEKTPDPVVYDHLGDAYDKLGKAKESREAWQKAAALDPDFKPAREKLARAAQGEGAGK